MKRKQLYMLFTEAYCGIGGYVLCYVLRYVSCNIST